MKVIIQRCRSATVTIAGEVHSSIARGLLLLVGIGTNDTQHESEWIATKLLSLKLFPENEGDEWGWKKSVVEAGGQVLSGELRRVGEGGHVRRVRWVADMCMGLRAAVSQVSVQTGTVTMQMLDIPGISSLQPLAAHSRGRRWAASNRAVSHA